MLCKIEKPTKSDSDGMYKYCGDDEFVRAMLDQDKDKYESCFGENYFSSKTKKKFSGWVIRPVDESLHAVTDEKELMKWHVSLPTSRGGFDWGRTREDFTRPYEPVEDSDMLLEWLVQQPNVVLADGKPLKHSDEQMPVTLTLTEEGGRIHGKVHKPGKGVRISPNYILDRDTLRYSSFTDVDEDFLREVTEEFTMDVADEVLSLVYSNIASWALKLEWDGRTVRESTKPVEPVPTVIMEQVDEGMNLHLSLTQTVGDFSPELCRDFQIYSYVSVREKEIVIRKVSGAGDQDFVDRLEEKILSMARTKKMARGLIRSGNSFVISQELSERFLYRELPWLLNNYKVLGSEKLRAYKLRAAFPKVNCKLSSGIDFLEGEATVDIGEERFTLADILAQYKKNRYVTLSDGDRVIMQDRYIKRLERIFRTSKKGKEVKVSVFDMDELEELLGRQLEGEDFMKRREVFNGLTGINKMKVNTPGLKGTLRPYQKSGLKWIKYLYDNNLGGCLADDMGLGKTIQTIAMLTTIYPKAKHPSLIVMPRSLVFNWQEELAKFAPHLNVEVYYGASRNLEKALTGQVILTTYAMVRNDIAQLKDVEFEYTVLDESQNIKNQTAQTTQAVWLLKGAHRLAISGTPIENNLDELYSLFRFLNPSMFGTPESFRTNYTLPIQRDEDKDATESLRRKIYPFILRRLKRDVLTDLPDRMDQTLYVEMGEEQARYYERRRRQFQEAIEASVAKSGIGGSQMMLLQAMGELRRIASVPEAITDGKVKSAKLEHLLDNLTSAVRNGHKCVVFFNYIAGLEMVSEYLQEQGIGHECMTGATTDRAGVVDRFQNGKDCRILLMTLKTGGVGLNLTSADTVFIYEPWWNKAAEEQGINRLHRIGQKSKVSCYSMITKGTIEEKIRQLQEKKSLLVDEIITTDSAGLKNLTQEDINFLFK